jgi:hypothetical protein
MVALKSGNALECSRLSSKQGFSRFFSEDIAVFTQFFCFPIAINAQSLEGETDASAIAQALCNRIYRAAFPHEEEIPPEVSNAYQVERLIPQIKKRLQKQNLALILDKCEPNQSQVTFCRKLTDVVHIAWITNQPLEAPMKGFLPEQANCLLVSLPSEDN